MTPKQQAYSDRVEANLKGLEAVSTGPCPDCQECADAYGFDTLTAFEEAWENGEVSSDGGFSWGGCGICGSTLGGTMEEWHAIAMDAINGRQLLHFDDACADCVRYLANGDLPGDER